MQIVAYLSVFATLGLLLNTSHRRQTPAVAHCSGDKFL